MSKEAAAAEVAEKPSGGGSSKKFLIIVVAVVVLILAAGGAALYVLMAPPPAEKQAQAAKGEGKKDAAHDEEEAPSKKSDEEEEEDDGGDEEKPPIYEKLETFTVNLADRESLLQVEIHFLMANPTIQGKLKERMPEVRNDILRVLSAKLPDELGTIEGKDALAKEIQKIVNELLGKKKSSGVKKVLFNSFILQ
jgi:flagellar protein FliL